MPSFPKTRFGLHSISSTAAELSFCGGAIPPVPIVFTFASGTVKCESWVRQKMMHLPPENQGSLYASERPRQAVEADLKLYQSRELPLPRPWFPAPPLDNGEIQIRDEQVVPAFRTRQQCKAEYWPHSNPQANSTIRLSCLPGTTSARPAPKPVSRYNPFTSTNCIAACASTSTLLLPPG